MNEDEDMPELRSDPLESHPINGIHAITYSFTCYDCLQKANRPEYDGLRYYCRHVAGEIPSWVKPISPIESA